MTHSTHILKSATQTIVGATGFPPEVSLPISHARAHIVLALATFIKLVQFSKLAIMVLKHSHITSNNGITAILYKDKRLNQLHQLTCNKNRSINEINGIITIVR